MCCGQLDGTQGHIDLCRAPFPRVRRRELRLGEKIRIAFEAIEDGGSVWIALRCHMSVFVNVNDGPIRVCLTPVAVCTYFDDGAIGVCLDLSSIGVNFNGSSVGIDLLPRSIGIYLSGNRKHE